MSDDRPVVVVRVQVALDHVEDRLRSFEARRIDELVAPHRVPAELALVGLQPLFEEPAAPLGGLQADWQQMVIVLSVLSLALGNIVAIAQSNIKRMLAWSSVAHAGYLLVGVVTMISPPAGGSSMIS